MILFDTDHISVIQSPGLAGAPLSARIAASIDQDFATSVVTIEEQTRGWLALIHRTPDVHRQIPAYDRLAKLFDFFADWTIVPFDRAAADEFTRLRRQRIRIGTMDLKIASIALVNDALLLTANLNDFQQVPQLQVENWLV